MSHQLHLDRSISTPPGLTSSRRPDKAHTDLYIIRAQCAGMEHVSCRHTYTRASPDESAHPDVVMFQNDVPAMAYHRQAGRTISSISASPTPSSSSGYVRASPFVPCVCSHR